MSETRYVNVVDTAKELRAALKSAFPGFKFGVRSSSYAGGASIDVSWTDGPTGDEVERVAKPFAGATFDGMVDLKSYHTSLYKGAPVRWGADYVFCRRKYSTELTLKAAARVGFDWGYDLTPAVVADDRDAYFDTTKIRTIVEAAGKHWSDAINIERELRSTRGAMRPNGVIVKLKTNIQEETEHAS